MSRMEDTNEYKWALKVVLKRQMRDLFDQLHESGEEVAVMSVNLDDGTCSQFGSSQGEWFLQEQRNLTNNFLKHCQQSQKRKDSRKSIFKGTTIASPSKDMSAPSSRKQPASKDVEASPTMSTRSSRSGRRVSSKYMEGIAALKKRPRKQSEDGGDEDETTEASVVGLKLKMEDTNPNVDPDTDSNTNVDDDELNDCNEDVSPHDIDTKTLLMEAVSGTTIATTAMSGTPVELASPKRTSFPHRPGMRYNRGEKLQCIHCPLSLKGKYALKAHIDRVHLNIRQAKCKVCSKSFWRNCTLQEHMLAVHTRQCESCQQYVVESTPWSEGVTMQTPRNVMCLCGSAVSIFTHKGATKKYLSDDEVDENGEVVKRKRYNTDEKFACGVCHKLFGSRAQCEIHQKIHSDVKSYVCHRCGTEFRYLKSLQRHMNTVHKAGKYPCDVCQRTFTHEHGLISHMMKIHGAGQSTLTGAGVEDESELPNIEVAELSPVASQVNE